MKATYTLIIKATGPHHQGHTTGNLEHDADHQLKSLVQKLQSTGHNVHLATFQIQDGTPEFIVGTADGKEPISKSESDGVTLDTVNTNVLDVLKILKRFEAYEKKDDTANKEPKPPKHGGKKETTAEVPKVEPKPEDPEVKPEEKPAAEQEQQQAGEADPKAPTETAPTQES